MDDPAEMNIKIILLEFVKRQKNTIFYTNKKKIVPGIDCKTISCIVPE